MSTHLADLSLSQASELIGQGEISPVALTIACQERIAALNESLNAFLTLTGEQALAAAHQTAAELRAGNRRSPLHGIPLGLKDLFETAGVPTTSGNPAFADPPPAADAEAVRRLVAGGAVLLGKQNMHEIALGITNVNPHYGPCRNPWNLEHVSGGSSGGSAAAVAVGMGLGALGSDTGGSIRIPAALCGVSGLKPTLGRVSLRGVRPLSWNLDHPGPLARSAADLAVLLQVIAGYDPNDPVSVAQPVDDYPAALPGGVRGWRIALAADPFFSRAEDSVLQAVQAAAQVFRSLGAAVVPTTPPDGLALARANGAMVVSDAAAVHRQRLLAAPEQFGADVLARLETGAAIPVLEYIEARRTQTEARRAFEQFFAEYDLLLTPTTPTTAPLIIEPDAVEQAYILTSFTAPFNLTGLPAISIPCGFTRQGLPVGLQIVAPAWAEARLLRAAHAYQTATDWHLRRPPVLKQD